MRARASQTISQTGHRNELGPQREELMDLHSQAVKALAEAIEVMYNKESKASNGRASDDVHRIIVGYYETVNYTLQDLFRRAKLAKTQKELNAIRNEYKRIISRLHYLKNNYIPEKRISLLLGESQHGRVKGTFFEWASNNKRLSRPQVLRERHEQLIRN
ncbi:MAG: hypothetical protein QXF76_01275 [Candidatus Anstonellales archaeon]